MLVVKICINEWKNESRDERELSVCRDLGADVKVVAKGNIDDWGRIDSVSGYEVHRLSTRPARKISVRINRIISIFKWAGYVRRMKPDIISGHDIAGLTIGWLSSLAISKRNKPKLVYDSHEFEIGRNANRNRFQIKIIMRWENFLTKHCSFVIVVNEYISKEIVKIHHLKEKPIVIRSVPLKWNVDQSICETIRKQMINQFENES